MGEAEEKRDLLQLINEDEVKLAALREEEATVHGQSGTHEFRPATRYANLISEARAIEERLHRNRQKLAAVTHSA